MRGVAISTSRQVGLVRAEEGRQSQISPSSIAEIRYCGKRLMGLGALGITGLAAGSIGAFFATYWDSIVKVFRGQ